MIDPSAAAVLGGPDLPQERRLVTDIPGPRSAELTARRTAAVARGVGSTLPVFVAAAGGGVLVDVDGNSLIDMGSGIAVVNVGNANPGVSAAVAGQAHAFTHTCFMITPVRGLRRGVRGTGPGHPRRPREALGAVQLRGRGGGERREDRPGRHRSHRGGGPRPRLPRPHEPHDGADREEHALQAGVRAVRPRDLPGADGLPVPLGRRRRALRRGGDSRGDRPDLEERRRRPTSRASWPNRSRARAGSSCRPPGSCRRWPTSARPTGSCSWPTRSRRASAAPARGSRASTRASSPTSSRPRRGSPAGCRWPR